MWNCPNSESHKKFIATAHVTQDWVIDELGDFDYCTDVCVEVLHSPDRDDLVTCFICGAQAIWR